MASPKLFTPYPLGPLTLRNRIVVPPMCMYSAEAGKPGQPGDWHLGYWSQAAQSGAGLFIIEATAVSPEGRISPADLGLWDDATEAAFARTLAVAHRHGVTPFAIQLAHAGRKASTRVPWLGGGQLPPAEGGWPVVAPSPLPFTEGDPAPVAADAQELARIRAAFVSAAQRARRLGIKAIELHGAHGYLLHEFMSPLSNQRQDEYGGSLENRLRFPLEVFDAVKAAVPDLPVGIRISASDWVPGGWDLAQSVVLAQALATRDCAFIHVSSGGLSPRQEITLGPNYQVHFAARIRAETGLPTIAVGLITEAEQAEAILTQGEADLVGIARAMLFDPHWAWHAAAKLGGQVDAPPQFWRSAPHGLGQLFANQPR